MNLWQRVQESLEQGMRQQITLSGAIFTAAIVMVGFAAFLSANNLLFLLLAALMSTFLLSGLIGRLVLAGLELSVSLPEHLAARRKASALIRVRNRKRVLPTFSIHLRGPRDSGLQQELYLPVIPNNSAVEGRVDLEFERRGVYADNSFQFSSRFPFGFTERRAKVRIEKEIVVYPCLDPQPGFEMLLSDLTGELSSQARGRGHDFYRLRPYEPLESARHVDWKASAHTGDLQVREFARDQDQAIHIVLDLDCEVGPAFEKTVDCAAFLSWRLSVRGARVRFQTQNFDCRVPEEADVYTVLRYLATVPPQRGQAPPVPDAETAIPVLLSANPLRSGGEAHGGGVHGDAGSWMEAGGAGGGAGGGDRTVRKRTIRRIWPKGDSA